MEENKNRSFFEAKWLRTVGVSAAALFLMVGSAYAVTTVSANLDTDGTLTVDGDVTLGDGGAGDNISLSSSGEGAIVMSDVGAVSIVGNSSVSMASFSDNVTLSTGLGDIDLDSANTLFLSSGEGSVFLTSGEGNIDLNAFGAVNVFSGVGNINLTPGTGLAFVSGSLLVSGLTTQSVQAGLTAFATGGQASATQITANAAIVAVVATAADSVKLPTAAAGLQVWVTNLGANSMDLFPFTGDAINEAAANSAKAVAVDASVHCVAYDATNWECVTMAR